ncbi:MAG: glutaredoxin family protein [Rubrivivax sp.]
MKTWLALLACTLAGTAWGQYKIVQPDGSVTYSDRPPTGDTGGKVTSLGRRGVASGSGGGEPSFPIDLRQAAARYPVTLYTGADCPPCDEARKALQQRGIPYAERRILLEEDMAQLARLSGGRTLPTATIGVQPLRGWNPDEWTSYLDLAGYPRESRLPRGWQPAAATPLVPRAASAPADGNG